MLSSSLRVLAVLTAVVAGLATGGSAGASTTAGGIPAHVYAPYFETWTTDGLAATAQRSGARYFTLAFVESTGKRSCTPAWDGDPSQPVAGGRYVRDLAALRRMGGDVVPSFGGYSADHGLTEIADSCRNLDRLVAAYRTVITRLGVTRLDMDVEDRSLSHVHGIERRNEALARVQRWAAAHGRPLQIVYTLPTTPTGIEPDALAVLRSAIAHHVRVDLVNIMTFDYYDGTRA
jgi:Glycosyl hydrolases family 18